jgi:hypothetical protein
MAKRPHSTIRLNRRPLSWPARRCKGRSERRSRRSSARSRRSSSQSRCGSPCCGPSAHDARHPRAHRSVGLPRHHRAGRGDVIPALLVCKFVTYECSCHRLSHLAVRLAQTRANYPPANVCPIVLLGPAAPRGGADFFCRRSRSSWGRGNAATCGRDTENAPPVGFLL